MKASAGIVVLVMPRRLLLLFFILFVAMIGFGITLPVLPFFVERLALGEGASTGTVAFHVGGSRVPMR